MKYQEAVKRAREILLEEMELLLKAEKAHGVTADGLNALEGAAYTLYGMKGESLAVNGIHPSSDDADATNQLKDVMEQFSELTGL